MLHFVRENKQSWIIYLILGVVCFVFVFFGVEAVVSGPGVTAVATVGDTPIEALEVQRAEFNLVAAYRNAYKDQFTDQVRESLQLRKQALDGLIDRAVLAEQAQKLGIEIGDDELRDVIVGNPGFQRDGRFNKEAYMRSLRYSQLTPAEYEASRRRDLAIQRLQQVIEDGVTVSEEAVRDSVMAEMETRTFTFVKLPTVEFEDHVDVDDEDALEAVYEENKAKYATPETVRAAMLVFAPDVYAAEVEVSDDDVTSFYSENKVTRFTQPHEVSARHILIKLDAGASEEDKAAAREKMAGVQKRLADGEDFAAVATEVSEDTGTAPKGGDLGFFGKGRMVPPFEEAAFALEVGEASDVVESPFGFHVIRVEEVREERVKPVDEAREEIVEELQEARGGEKAKQAAEAAHASIAGGKSFDDVAADNGLKILTPEPFAQNASVNGVGRSFPLTSALFTLEAGQVTEVTAVEKKWVIARLDEKVPSATPPLEDVRARVVGDLRSSEGEKAGKAAAAELIAKAKAVGSLEEAVEAAGRKIETSQSFSRQSPYVPGMGVNQPLKDAVFALTDANPVADEPFVVLGDAIAVGLGETTLPTDDELRAKMEETRKALLQQSQQRLFQRYVDELKAGAKIQVNAALLDQLPPV